MSVKFLYITNFFYKRLSKIDINNLSFTFLIFEFFIFFLTKNYINKEIYTAHILIILLLLILFIKNIDLSHIKKKLLNIKYIFFYLLILISIYSIEINYSEHLNKANNCKIINLILRNSIDCSYSFFFLIGIFILFFFLFYLNKLKISFTKVFVSLVLIFITIAFCNLIIYYLIYTNIIKTNYLSLIFPFSGDYRVYFQYLPFATPSKRSEEILIYVLGYSALFILYFSRNKKEKNKLIYLIHLFFISAFLTYSKNIWLYIFMFTSAVLIYKKKKIEIVKVFSKSLILLILTIFMLFLIQSKIDTYTLRENKLKKHYMSIIDYTFLKFNFKYNNENKQFYNPALNISTYFNFNKENSIKFENEENNYDPNYYFNSIPERALIYKTIINKLNINNIFLGHGLNSINFTVPGILNEYQSYKIVNPESQILQILYEVGLAGLIIYSLLLSKFIKVITAEGKILLFSLLSLMLFTSYQESILFIFLLATILGCGAKNKFDILAEPKTKLIIK